MNTRRAINGLAGVIRSWLNSKSEGVLHSSFGAIGIVIIACDEGQFAVNPDILGYSKIASDFTAKFGL